MAQRARSMKPKFAIFILSLGIFLNEWVLAKIFSPDGVITTFRFRICLLFFDLFLIALAWVFIRFQSFRIVGSIQKATQNIFLCVLALILFGAIFEAVLSFGVFDRIHAPNPVWIPLKYRKLDQQINLVNTNFSADKPHRFNDSLRLISKPKGKKRIAILGDSFVWGDGVPYDVIWSHKLEKKIMDYSEGRIEVLSWGGNGWSTMDEFEFLKKYGIEYDIDFLIVGFVDNDVCMRDPYVFQILIQPNSYSLGPIRKVYPLATDFMVTYLNTFYNKFIYNKNPAPYRWYAKENLQEYFQLLAEFRKLCESKSIRLLFALTPVTYEKDYETLFQKVIPLFERAGISYLDLYPAISRKLGVVSPRTLWANPANHHPGNLDTEVFADEVFSYLKENRILDSLLLSAHE